MEIGNIFLFIRTIIYCLKVKEEINKINDNKAKKGFNADKEQ